MSCMRSTLSSTSAFRNSETHCLKKKGGWMHAWEREREREGEREREREREIVCMCACLCVHGNQLSCRHSIGATKDDHLSRHTDTDAPPPQIKQIVACTCTHSSSCWLTNVMRVRAVVPVAGLSSAMRCLIFTRRDTATSISSSLIRSSRAARVRSMPRRRSASSRSARCPGGGEQTVRRGAARRGASSEEGSSEEGSKQ